MINKIGSFLSLLFYRARKKIQIKKFINSNLNKKEEYYVEQLNKNGFVVIKNFITPKNCKKIQKTIDNTIKNYSDKLCVDKIKSDKRIFGAESLDNEIKKFFSNKFIRRIGENYCKYKIKNMTTMANRVDYKYKNEGSGAGWHRDSYFNQFKSIVYLNDVNINNGPFEILIDSEKFSNSLKVAFMLNKNCTDSRFTNKDIKKISFMKRVKLPAKAGTLIMANVSSIHRGSPLKESKRYALMNYYFPKDIIGQYKTRPEFEQSFS